MGRYREKRIVRRGGIGRERGEKGEGEKAMDREQAQSGREKERSVEKKKRYFFPSRSKVVYSYKDVKTAVRPNRPRSKCTILSHIWIFMQTPDHGLRRCHCR